MTFPLLKPLEKYYFFYKKRNLCASTLQFDHHQYHMVQLALESFKKYAYFQACTLAHPSLITHLTIRHLGVTDLGKCLTWIHLYQRTLLLIPKTPDVLIAEDYSIPPLPSLTLSFILKTSFWNLFPFTFQGCHLFSREG